MQVTKKLLTVAIVVFVISLLIACSRPVDEQKPLINLQHLDYLYTHLTVENQKWAGIVIYAEYPDYAYFEAPGEGLICVDDVARAAIVYLRYGHYYKDEAALKKADALMRTILYLQAPNGCFFNFITAEGKIQKELKNSKPLPNWWTWRALWALAEYTYWNRQHGSTLLDSVQTAVQKVLPHVQALTEAEGQWQTINGFKIPLWLPQKYAADQGGLLVKALTSLYKAEKDEKVLKLIRQLSDGLLAMQVRDERSPFYGAFLSWQNVWHAYGNIQADALFDAFEATGDSAYFKAALLELRHFYPVLKARNFLRSAKLQNDNGRVTVIDQKQFEQIAYDFRPMVWAALHAWRLTGEAEFLQLAVDLSAWFGGENLAGVKMYDPQTGRCFDGIISPKKVNLNSGAESTIEALLALLEAEKDVDFKKQLPAFWQ
ncbi:hypothetical protein [Caldithrix abyssi]